MRSKYYIEHDCNDLKFVNTFYNVTLCLRYIVVYICVTSATGQVTLLDCEYSFF